MDVAAFLKEQLKKREQDIEEKETEIGEQERRVQEIETEIAAGQDDKRRQHRLNTLKRYLRYLETTQRSLKEEKATLETSLGNVPQGIFFYQKLTCQIRITSTRIPKWQFMSP